MIEVCETRNPIPELYKSRVFSNQGFQELIALMADEERFVLDVGCGDGANARLMKALGKTVYAVTLSEAEAKSVAPHVDRVVLGDIERMHLDLSFRMFDAILLSHVLEHLVDPWAVLARLRGLLRAGGRVYLALPNVAFYQERMKLLFGRFRYSDAGIIDRLHLRFFTYNTAKEMVEQAGYRVAFAKGLGSFPMWPLRRLFPGRTTWVDRLACAVFPNLFGWHIIVVGENPGTPAVSDAPIAK